MVTDEHENSEEETQEEQVQEETGDEGNVGQESEHTAEIGEIYDEKAQQPEKKKRERKEPVVLMREIGKSLLPFARVQKIIKADKDIPMVAKDATFLISLATEEFIMRLSEAAKRVAEREKRSTVQHKDIATVVRRWDEFVFLEEIIPWLSSEPIAKRKPKGNSGVKETPTLLDQFLVTSKGTEDEDRAESPDVVMNEDGTISMVVAGDLEMENQF